MSRMAQAGRMIFGAAIAALGIEHFVCARLAVEPFPAQFHAVVLPVIPWVPAHPWLAYLVGVMLVAAGMSLVLDVRARTGAWLAGAIFGLSAVILHLPRMIQVPGNWGYRGEVCEMLAFSSAAFVLAVVQPRISRIIFGIAAIVFGVDHFLALNLIAGLVPAWMPAHLFLASLAGIAMIVCGVCIAVKWHDRLAALALGAVFLVFVLTLHAPRVLAAMHSADEWSSGLIALGMCGASWLMAGDDRK